MQINKIIIPVLSFSLLYLHSVEVSFASTQVQTEMLHYDTFYIGKPYNLSVEQYSNTVSIGTAGSGDSQFNLTDNTPFGYFPFLLSETPEKIQEYIETLGVPPNTLNESSDQPKVMADAYEFLNFQNRLKVKYLKDIPTKEGYYFLKNNTSIGLVFFNLIELQDLSRSTYYNNILKITATPNIFPKKRPNLSEELKDKLIRRSRIAYYHVQRADNFVESIAIYTPPSKFKDIAPQKIILMQAFYPAYLKSKLLPWLPAKVHEARLKYERYLQS